MSEGWYFVSSPRMTVAVRLDAAGVVDKTAPIVRKFRGQPWRNLWDWMVSHGGETKWVKLP